MNAQTRAETLIELTELTDGFFRAVSFEEGTTPPYADIRALFIEKGLLVKNSGALPDICNLREFIEPRQASVQAGDLTRFHEAEISHTSEVFGNVAHRFSTYTKSGTLLGAPFEAKGMVSTQFIRTPDGWRISSMVWDDERQGLALADHWVAS
jgi:hypothetical protein